MRVLEALLRFFNKCSGEARDQIAIHKIYKFCIGAVTKGGKNLLGGVPPPIPLIPSDGLTLVRLARSIPGDSVAELLLCRRLIFFCIINDAIRWMYL